jgi:hypothetical protein
MSPRLAARTAALCTLIFGVVIARADREPAKPLDASEIPRRPVAVIDLTDTAAGEDLARKLGNELNNHHDLKPVDDQQMPGALMGSVKDDDAERIDEARKSRQSAEIKLGRFDFDGAATDAVSGQDKLTYANPSPAAVVVYAELAFVLGQAKLGLRKDKEAASAFAFAHQLNPSFAPDPARYLPEVVQAFETAKAVTLALGKIQVMGNGRVWIDGTEKTEPAWYEAPAGVHVVWLVGPERDPRARRVLVVAGQKVTAEIEDARSSDVTRVRRARVALKEAADATARAAAIHQLATLLKVKDAVLLTTSNGKTIVQTWRDQAPGFSALRELKKETTPRELLTPLAPLPIPKKVKPPDPVIPKKFVVPEEPWYRNTTYQISGGVAGTVVIVVGILLIRSINRTVSLDTDPSVGGAGTMSR